MIVRINPALLGNFKNPALNDILVVTDAKNSVAMRIGYDGTVYSSRGGSALNVDKITFSDGSVQTSAYQDCGTF